MAVTTTQTNKPINPRGNDQSPKGYNRASLYSGKALDFDGVNDSVSVADSNDLDGFTNFTICAIIKADTLPNYCRIITKGSGVYYVGVQYPGNGELEFYANGTRFFSEFVLNTGEYVHFAISFTGGQDVKFYQNGQLKSTQTHSISGTGTNSNNVVIGRNVTLNGNPWDGHISNVKIFNTALTAAQVADLYNNPEKVVPTGVDNTALKLWLPMQEGAGTTAYDGSGNGNHGTISGATWTHGIGAPVAQTAVIDWNKGTNYVKQSEDFDNSDWQQLISGNSSSLSVTDNYAEAPDGSQTAARIQASHEGGAGDSYAILSTTASASTTGSYTSAVWIKSNTGSAQTIAFYTRGSSTNTLDITTEWVRYDIVGSGSSNYFNFGARSSTGTTQNCDFLVWGALINYGTEVDSYVPTYGTAQENDVLLPQGLTTGRDITGVNPFENVRKQGALNLDGNSWAEVHDNAGLDITDAITLEAWVYWDGSSNKGILGRWHNDSNNRNYLLYKATATNVNFYINTSAIATYSSLSATKGWTHIVGTYNRTNAVLYVDGVQQATTAHTTAISTGTLPVEIGRNFTTINQALTAPIAQPRIYNRALTAEEVARNYQALKHTYQ